MSEIEMPPEQPPDLAGQRLGRVFRLILLAGGMVLLIVAAPYGIWSAVAPRKATSAEQRRSLEAMGQMQAKLDELEKQSVSVAQLRKELDATKADLENLDKRVPPQPRGTQAITDDEWQNLRDRVAKTETVGNESRDNTADKLNRINARIDKLDKPAVGGKVDDTAVARLGKRLDALEKAEPGEKMTKRLAALRKDLTDEAAKKYELRGEREKLEAKVKELEKALEANDKKLAPLQKLTALPNEVKDLSKKLDGLTEKVSRAPKTDPTDVLVLGMHSTNLSIHEYVDLIKEFTHPKTRAGALDSRIGFYIAEGAGFEKIYPLAGGDGKEGDAKLAKLQKARKGTTTRLTGQGDKVRAEYGDSKARKRCVLIAGIDSNPEDDSPKSWEGITVQVVLILRDGDEGTTTEKQVPKWHAFCRERGWPLMLIRSPDPENPDEKAKSQLRNFLQLATSPSYLAAKR